MACPSASPRRSARGQDVPGLRYETALAASPRYVGGEVVRSSLAASPRSERSARGSATATPRASSSAAAAGAPGGRRVPLLALDRAVRPGPDGPEGVHHAEVADTARVWKAVPVGQVGHGLQVVSHSHPNIALQALTSARRHTVRDSAVVDMTQDELQDTSRVWRSRSRTFEALTSARVHPRTPAQRRPDGGAAAAGVPSVSLETIDKLMDMLEMCTSAHNEVAAPSGGALSSSVRSRRTKSNTPMRKGRRWEELGDARRQSMPRCETPPQRWHTPPPTEKSGVDDSQPGNFHSQSSLETSSFVTGDEYAEAEDDADAPPAAMFSARVQQERPPSACTVKSSPGRDRHVWKTPRYSDDDEAPLSILASSPRRSSVSSPQPVNRLPPFHPAPRRKKQDFETPLTSARYETARSTAVYQLEAELAEQRETSKRAMDEKRDTEHRLNVKEAKNEELEGKLKRLAEGMLKATSKISDLESRLAERGHRDADSSFGDGSSGAHTPKPALSARLAEVEAQLSGGWQRGWPSCEALEAQLSRHRELLAAEEGTAQRIAELEARVLATSLDAAVASDERRLEAQRSRCDALEESLAERCRRPDVEARARVLELEELLEVQAREHEEALAKASEESLQCLQASEAKCRQLEEKLAKQKEAAATVEAATVELFTDLQEQVAAKDRHKEAMEKKLKDLEQRAERAEAESRALEGQLADLQPSAAAAAWEPDGAEQAAGEGDPQAQQQDSERLQELEATLRECRQQILELEAKDGALGARLAEQLELVAAKDARIAELQAEADAKEERIQSSVGQVEGHLQRLREAQDVRERLEERLSRQGDEAAAAAGSMAARVAELESQVGKKDAEQEEALRKAAEEGRQRLRVFETLCEELSQQLEEQRRCMASSDAENARRVASLEEELADSSQRLQTAEVEAKYSEGCLRANEVQTAQLQAELAQVREDSEVEADKAASRIAELEARLALTQAKLSGQQEALDEVLARRAAEHTQRLRTSEARGQELELRLKRLSTSPTRRPSAEAAAQTESSGGDSDALKDAVRTACMRLGADWAQWLRRSSGRRLIVPAWRGVYLSFPKAEVAPATECDGMPTIDEAGSCGSEEEDREDDDGVPLPPGSRFWDWPLSRREKRERAVFVDRQMLLADQRALMDHTEVLRSSCLQHGVAVTPYLWD